MQITKQLNMQITKQLISTLINNIDELTDDQLQLLIDVLQSKAEIRELWKELLK